MFLGLVTSPCKGKARFYSNIQAAFHGDLLQAPPILSDLVHRTLVQRTLRTAIVEDVSS